MYIPDLTERYPEGFRGGDDFETYIVRPNPVTPEYPCRLFTSWKKGNEYSKLLTALGIENSFDFADEDDIRYVRMLEEAGYYD